MEAKLKKGDKVEWGTSQGKTRGVIKKKLTSPTTIKGHKVAASKKKPEYLVESGKSGGEAAHKPDSLKKTEKDSTQKDASKKRSSGNDDDEVVKDFKKLVNVTTTRLEKWLDTEESKKVGFKDDGKGESVGHGSGKKIVKLLQKSKNEYTPADLKHIHKVVGYIKRHLAQRPRGDVTKTNWRYSLLNWGHDPRTLVQGQSIFNNKQGVNL